MSEMVVDASAILAYLNEDPGADQVAAVLEHGGAIIGSTNLAEVAARLMLLGTPPSAAREIMRALGLKVIDLDEETAWTSAALIAQTRPHGLSLGDRCCLALARQLSLPVLTADRAWAIAGLDIDVRLIR